MEDIIRKAIMKAQKNNPGLAEMDNPYERIAQYLPGGYESLIPSIDDENSFEYSDRVIEIVDSVWMNL